MSIVSSGFEFALTRDMRILEGLPLWGNLILFAVAAVVVWRAGTRLAEAAEAIAQRTGLGQAFVGALFLGGATSLPEIAATGSASLLGNAPIAVNNIFGGIAMQVAILCIADLYGGGVALSSQVRHPAVLLEGVLLVLVLATATVAIGVGDLPIAGVGLWTGAILGLVVFSLLLIKRYEGQAQWEVRTDDENEREAPAGDAERVAMEGTSTRGVVMQMVLASLAVLAGGFAVAKAGERIAEMTGLGGSFVGAILMPVATSMPELSTTLAAVRIGAPVMAVSNIFGTNLFDASILFLIDAAYPGGPVLNEVGRFSQVGALLGIACTCIYLAGILWRRERTFLRLGIDSIGVLLVYGGGVLLLYTIR